MINSCIVNDGEHLEIICHYIEKKEDNSDGSSSIIRKYIPSNKIDKIDLSELDNTYTIKKVIGLFRTPNYGLFYKIRTESLKVHIDDNNKKIIYTDPLETQRQIMNKLLYAYQDQNGVRTDIVKENANKYISQMDPNIMLGLYREFINKCGVDFEDR